MEFELATRNRDANGESMDSLNENQTGEIQRHYPRHRFIAYLLTFSTLVQLIVSTFLLVIGTESLILEFSINLLSLASTFLVIQWLAGRSRLNENIRLIDHEVKDRIDTSLICGLAVFQSTWVSVDLIGIFMNWGEFILTLKAIFGSFDATSWFDNDLLDLTAFMYLATKIVILLLYFYFLRLSFRTLRSKNDFANVIATNGVLIVFSGAALLIGVTTILFCVKYPMLSNVVPSSWFNIQFFFALLLFTLGFYIIKQSKYEKGSVNCLVFTIGVLTFMSIAITVMNFDYSQQVEKYYSGITDPVDYKHIATLINEDEYKYTACPDKYLPATQSCPDDDKVIRWEDINDGVKYRCLNMQCSNEIGDLISRGFYTLADSSLFCSMSIGASLIILILIKASQSNREYKISPEAQNIFVAFGLAAAFIFCAASLSHKKIFLQTNHKQVEGVYIENFLSSYPNLHTLYQDFRFKEFSAETLYDFLVDQKKYVTIEVKLEESEDFDMEVNSIGDRNKTYNDFITDMKEVKSGVSFGFVNLYVENVKAFFFLLYVSPDKINQTLRTIKARTDVDEGVLPTEGNFTFIGAEGKIGLMLTSEESALDLEFVLHEFKTQFDAFPQGFGLKSVIPYNMPVSKSYDPEIDYDKIVFTLPKNFDPDVAAQLNRLGSDPQYKAVEIYLDDQRKTAIAKEITSYLHTEMRRDLIVYILFEYEDVSRPVAILLPSKEPFKTTFIQDFVEDCVNNAVPVVELEDSDTFEMSWIIQVGAVSNPGARIKISEDYLESIK